MLNIFWIGMAYLLGSVPFGLLIAKCACGIDPRKDGSRNIGATNVSRLCGFKYGLAALALDILKGFVPVAMATAFSDSVMFLSLTALAAVIGHMYSVFLHGQGGKAVATTVGVFLALAPWQLILSAILCILVIFWSGFVSLGSLTLVTALPVMLLLTGHLGYFLAALIIMALVFWKHRENISRLARGEEKPWRKRQSGK